MVTREGSVVTRGKGGYKRGGWCGHKGEGGVVTRRGWYGHNVEGGVVTIKG